MKVVLIGNYEPDGQESMQRFGNLLFEWLKSQGISVELLKPPVLFGRLNLRFVSLNKWLGYLDKYVVFPAMMLLMHRNWTGAKASVVVHICDHSNAPYVRCIRSSKVIVTCHDLLAVRSAFGEFPENPTGMFGRNLQRLILDGLVRAPRVACVSEMTRSDLARLSKRPNERVAIVPNGLNYRYRPMTEREAAKHLRELFGNDGCNVGQFEGADYILHVGGNQWYKNRKGVLQIYRRLLELMPHAPKLVIAGKPLADGQRAWIAFHRLEQHVLSVVCPGNETLCALYSRAAVMLFPSLAEGFGWPILEAQACGCPVVTSNRQPMLEIGGDSAFYCNPRNSIESAALLQRVLSLCELERSRVREDGLRNVTRYSARDMMHGYLKQYTHTLAN